MLKHINSGYKRGINQWIEFLDSWNREQQIKNDALFLVEGYRIPSIFEHGKRDASKLAQGSDQLAEELAKAEERLDIDLPDSYKDFVLALGEDYLLNEAITEDVSVGIFHPSKIDSLIKSDPFLLQLMDERNFPKNLPYGAVWEGDSTDSKYFIYGIEQDHVAERMSYWNRGIVIGMYGNSLSEKIVLYPDVRTEDGEFETGLWFSSSEFRAITFAEVMRQLYFMETKNMEHVAPYSQQLLKGTAAEKISLDIWWK